MRIAEIFRSIQGEGQYAGTPSTFVRTTGCNLRCWFCDTPYASWEPEGRFLPWPSVLNEVERLGCEHVVLTGGEPMLQPDLVPLTRALGPRGFLVTIETAGTVDRPVHADLISISPKLSNSVPKSGRWRRRHEQRLRQSPQIVRSLMARYSYQLKFVVDRPEDWPEIEAYLSNLGPDLDRRRVWLMPQASTPVELSAKACWLHELAARHGCRVSPRLHVELFGNRRGT
ncbi:MAG TPA: 7-carboxy-7-deazaguanine synthase QueE [Planctomycetaceae bacterium]|nr:7-carboxy-7-deazaguanine synthase QueE [Planctomycetaceae bacterium]